MEQECNLIKFWNCPASVKMTLDKNAINIQTEPVGGINLS